jgi:hypothetical protein
MAIGTASRPPRWISGGNPRPKADQQRSAERTHEQLTRNLGEDPVSQAFARVERVDLARTL